MKTARQIINESLFAKNYSLPDDLWKKDAKIGSTLRIRLPGDYKMMQIDENERFKRQQRLDCIREAMRLGGSNDIKKIISDAKEMYKFVKG